MPRKSVPTPRPWFRLDVDFLHQDTIRTLLREFGPSGPLAFVAIVAEAKKADLGGTRTPSEQGIVSMRTAALASILETTPEAVGAIVSRSVELGLLECLPNTDLDSGRLVVRSLKRGAWEPKDATAAARQARKRQADEDSEDDEDKDYLSDFG